MRKWLSIKILFIICLALFSTSVFAELSPFTNTLDQDKNKIVFEQIDLLKNRLTQAQNEVTKLQFEQDNQQLSPEHANKQLLQQSELDVRVAKSNLDSVSVELAESQQSIIRLEKDTQEIQNQLNVYNMFGVKVARNGAPNLNNLKSEFERQQTYLQLEKTRENYLEQLQENADKSLQFYKTKYLHIQLLLKSQTMMQLKEQQARYELGFQQQQNYWLQQLETFYSQLKKLEQNKQINLPQYEKLENEIFYAKENLNFTYLQMLTGRYQDELQQLRLSISRSSSIIFLNKVSEQTQVLSKQLTHTTDLLKTRIDILEKRKSFISETKKEDQDSIVGLTSLIMQYNSALTDTRTLINQLESFRTALDQSLKQELSLRQGLPGLSANAWLDLGGEFLLLPSLTFQVMKSLTSHVVKAVHTISYGWWAFFFALEMAWVGVFYSVKAFLMRLVSGMPDHEFGHINIKWLGIKLLQRNLLDIAIIGNVTWLFYFCNIPMQNSQFLINLAWVWLFFKMINTIARLCLVETVHDREGHDVKLYHRLKWSFIIGGVITALTTFINQLPIVYEVKDLFCRLFLLFLLIVAIVLLKSRDVLSGLILPYIDERHTYVKRIVRLVGFLLPTILLINSAIGLFGFMNFVQTISWYDGVFLLVLMGYLLVRGFLISVMDFSSHLLIRHVANGWLWTEAFLKPIDKIIRVILFFSALTILFILYGWDRQSLVVGSITKILHYPLVNLLNASITLLNIIALGIVASFFYWAARWTREFVYRFLLSRTKDLGIRNSIAILSQYTMVLIGLLVCLRVLGIDFRALTFVASAFALGVGLGLRDLVNNFACGFLLLLERPLRVGDTVKINDYEGEVLHIGSRAVTIRTWDHMEVLVPNAEIFSKSFTNWTGRDHVVRTVITIKINRHDNPISVQNLIYQVLEQHKDVLADPASEVFLKELSDGLIEFEVRYYINLRQVKSRTAVRSNVLIAIWETFEKHGIQPPYPHHEIYVKTGGLLSTMD